MNPVAVLIRDDDRLALQNDRYDRVGGTKVDSDDDFIHDGLHQQKGMCELHIGYDHSIRVILDRKRSIVKGLDRLQGNWMIAL